MNYKDHYDRLMNRSPNERPVDRYTEEHHKIPLCFCTTCEPYSNGQRRHPRSSKIRPECKLQSPDNRVFLAAREHFIAHQLLVKMYPDNHELVIALHFMSSNTTNSKIGRHNNRTYGWIKEKNVVSRSIMATAVHLARSGKIPLEKALELASDHVVERLAEKMRRKAIMAATAELRKIRIEEEIRVAAEKWILKKQRILSDRKRIMKKFRKNFSTKSWDTGRYSKVYGPVKLVPKLLINKFNGLILKKDESVTDGDSIYIRNILKSMS